MMDWNARQTAGSLSEAALIKMLHEKTEADCPQCQKGVEAATPEQAAAITDIASRVVNRWLKDNCLHSWTTTEGVVLVCLKSLRDLYADSLRATREVPAIDRSLLAMAEIKK